MTQFDDRERAFETKFAHDEEMKFRVLARRNRLLGEWAAPQDGPVRRRDRVLRQGRGPRRLRGSGRRGRHPQGARRPHQRRQSRLDDAKSARRWSTRASKRAARSSRRQSCNADAGERDRAADRGRDARCRGDDHRPGRRRRPLCRQGGQRRLRRAEPGQAQHQLVYAALGGRMGGELHALQLQTAAPEEIAQ